MNARSLSHHLAAFVASALAVLALGGCVATKYREARKGTPAARSLNVPFAPAPLEATLVSVVTYNGPGSWKRNAFWDEYVVALHNPGPESLTLSSATLVDATGSTQTPGRDPWALEKASKTLEQKYKDAGIAFVRYSVPGVLIFGTGVAVA